VERYLPIDRSFGARGGKATVAEFELAVFVGWKAGMFQ
jgi:hypothetical protein